MVTVVGALEVMGGGAVVVVLVVVVVALVALVALAGGFHCAYRSQSSWTPAECFRGSAVLYLVGLLATRNGKRRG